MSILYPFRPSGVPPVTPIQYALAIIHAAATDPAARQAISQTIADVRPLVADLKALVADIKVIVAAQGGTATAGPLEPKLPS